MKIALNDATATQLARFATINLGLEVTHLMGAAKLRSMMSAAGYDKDHIEIEDAAPPAAAPKADAEPVAARKTVRIMIPKQPGPGGSDAVPVGVNGKVALIKRAEWVDVPVEYVHALENAQTVQFEHGPNGEPINPTLVPKIPFSVQYA